MKRIRPIAICILRDSDRMFVGEYHDPVRQETYYRPLGGAIEFGERSEDCVAREIREEAGAEIQDLRYLGVLENIFTDGGRPGHEVVFVYMARFCDPRFYRVSAIECQAEGFVAIWKPIADLRDEKARLYPSGLLDLLDPFDERSKQ